MATVKRVTLQWAATHPIYLGYCQENNVRIIEIDVSPIEEEYPGCVYEVFVQRPGEKTGYTADTTAENGIITWTLTSFDTYIAGDGKIMVRAKQGHAIKKTVTMTTITGEALDAQINSSAPSESVPGWLDQALSAAGDARDSAKAAQTEADKATVSATNAKEDADRAEAAASEAVGAKTSVEAIGEGVKTAAENAATSAGEAKASATAAQTAETDAKFYREAAATSANDAKETLATVEQKLADGELKGEKGDPGKDGKDGKDAEVTAESVEAALGYKPIKDVQVAGTSVLADGVAKVPIAQEDAPGVVSIPDPVNSGIWNDNGNLRVSFAKDSEISGRVGNRKTIVCANMDYAVKAAMCDGKGAAWTSAEQQAARNRMGLDKPYELIEEIDITEEVSYIERKVSLKKVMVKTECPAATAATLYIIINFDGVSTNYSMYCGNITNPSGKTYSTSFFGVDRGLSYFLYLTPNQAITNAASIGTQHNVSGLAAEKMTKIMFTNVAFPVGSKIQIYGVRA